MNTPLDHPLYPLLDAVAGTRRAEALFMSVEVPDLGPAQDGRSTRAELAMGLAMLLFEDVCERVPMARAYTADVRRSGRRVLLDHGALRTIAAPCGELPPGKAAFARILEPLGYREGGVYPLDRLSMTGFSFVHTELPGDIPQYFVSELEPERFSTGFQAAAGRIFGTSRDPLPASATDALARLAEEGSLPLRDAARLLPNLLACFDRQHEEPSLADYELLAAESDEAAWISTEGQVFNHATDRVTDVAAVADEQRRLGRPIKDAVEVSSSGRVVQTAFRATTVERLFVDGDGQIVVRPVPGSFHELITRHRGDDGELDLAFDASNAQGIFVMTRRESTR